MTPSTAWIVVGLLTATSVAADPPQYTKEQCADAYVKAQQSRRRGELRSARSELLICARDPCPPLLQKDCSPWLSEVDALIPSIVFVARDANGHDLTDVVVTVDGQPLVERLDGRPVDVDPGAHVFVFTAGVAGISQHVLVHEGEKARRIVVSLATAATAAPRSAAPPRRPIPTTVWIVGGIGAAGLATAAVAGAANVPVWLRCHDGGCSVSEKHDSDLLNTIGDVGLVIGGLGAAVAAYFYVTRPTIEIEPAVGEHGSTVFVRLHF